MDYRLFVAILVLHIIFLSKGIYKFALYWYQDIIKNIFRQDFHIQSINLLIWANKIISTGTNYIDKCPFKIVRKTWNARQRALKSFMLNFKLNINRLIDVFLEGK